MPFAQTTTVEDATPFSPTELPGKLFPVIPANYHVSLVKNWLAVTDEWSVVWNILFLKYRYEAVIFRIVHFLN